MLSPLLLPDLRIAIQERDWETIAAFGIELHPRDVAELLESLEEPEAVHAIFDHWASQVAASVLEYLPPTLQDDLVERLDRFGSAPFPLADRHARLACQRLHLKTYKLLDHGHGTKREGGRVPEEVGRVYVARRSP